MKSSSTKILLAKEQRFLVQQKLFIKYSLPIMTINLNIPGLVRNKKKFLFFFKKIKKQVLSFLKENKIIVLKSKYINNIAGPFLILMLKDNFDILYLKEQLLTLENNNDIFQLVDIDLYDNKNQKISRDQLNFKKKKCYLCSKSAKICAKLKTHKYVDLINFIETKIDKFLK